MDVSAKKAKDILLKLQRMHDFKHEKTNLERLLATNGYRRNFIPKFHCELNPKERLWAQSKKYTRLIVELLSQRLSMYSVLLLVSSERLIIELQSMRHSMSSVLLPISRGMLVVELQNLMLNESTD